VRDYLEKFGDRCIEELKLESKSLHDDALPLYRSVGAMSGRLEALPRANLPPPNPEELLARTGLGERPLRAQLFRWVLQHARDRVRERENLRFERTRLFGRIRQIFSQLGRQFQALGELDNARDIFYLEIDEVLGFCEGTATCPDLKALALARRCQFEKWQMDEPPPNRFESRGLVNHALERQTKYPGPVPAASGQADNARIGLGCCPGRVRGLVRRVIDPRQAELRPGEILVAERTDPGWVLLFPVAAGLLVERGSLLSHSAIVARELGLPAIVGLPGLMEWLRSGDEVELDGATGEVWLKNRA